MCNPCTMLSDYYLVLKNTTKEDWQTIFNNLGLIQALILSTAYGVSGWADYSDLDECGNAEAFYIYANLVQQLGLAGVVVAILMVQFAGMAATDEKKAQDALGTLTPLFIVGVCIDALVTLVMGFAIVLLDENVHSCQYKLANPGEEFHAYEKFPAVLYLRLGIWGGAIVVALVGVMWTSSVTAKYLKEQPKKQETELAVKKGENRCF